MTVQTLSTTAPVLAMTDGFVLGGPGRVLRAEGLAVLALTVYGFHAIGGSWGWFAALFLTPDLSMLGYLAGRRVGAIAYNSAHSYLGPALLGAAGLALSAPLPTQLALIWAAHIGFDRALGYGLKYPTAFGHTHLGPAGRDKS